MVHQRQSYNRNANSVYYRIRNLFLCREKGFPDRPGEDRMDLFLRLYEASRKLEGAARRAARQALADGLAGRFGQRGADPGRFATAVAIAPARLGLLPSRLRRRVS